MVIAVSALLRALFAVVSLILHDPEKISDASRSFLGVVLPLIGGVMAAYAILEDPALELRFATPIPASHYVDLRRGGQKGERLAGARHVCISCHVPRTDARPLVGSRFRP